MDYHKDKFTNLFSGHDRLGELEKLGDPLVRVSKCIDFEFFRATLEAALYGTHDSSKGGRPPFDPVMMLKILFLQRFDGSSDDAIEYLIRDRLSFQRFLGKGLAGTVPDAKTIWLFRDTLEKKDLIRRLFDELNLALLGAGLIATEGQIVDATFVQAPRGRNSREENKTIKAGNTPPEWKKNPHVLAQRDVDARWAKKGGERHYGYKDHLLSDKVSKLITDYMVTNAAVHDSQVFEDLLELGIADHQELFADSAYRSAESEEILSKRGIVSKVHFKAARNRPLTDQEKKLNKERSKHRARVEHIFAFMTNSLGGIIVRGRSLARNEAVIGLMNLTYNLARITQLNFRLEPDPA